MLEGEICVRNAVFRWVIDDAKMLLRLSIKSRLDATMSSRLRELGPTGKIVTITDLADRVPAYRYYTAYAIACCHELIRAPRKYLLDPRVDLLDPRYRPNDATQPERYASRRASAPQARNFFKRCSVFRFIYK